MAREAGVLSGVCLLRVLSGCFVIRMGKEGKGWEVNERESKEREGK